MGKRQEIRVEVGSARGSTKKGHIWRGGSMCKRKRDARSGREDKNTDGDRGGIRKRRKTGRGEKKGRDTHGRRKTGV